MTLQGLCATMTKNFPVAIRGVILLLPPWDIMEIMSKHMPPTPKRERPYLESYYRLRRLCIEIQRGRYPTKKVLAALVERSERTVQNDLRALKNDFDAPLEFDPQHNGFYFTDPAWRIPAIALTEGELISFFAAERMLRRLHPTADVQLARSAVRGLAALLPQEVVIDLGAIEDAMSIAPEPILDVAPEVLRQLATAAMRRQTLHIHYYSQYRAEATEREVDVLLLHNALGEWYAICYDHYRQAIRDFHAGRITSIRDTRRTFTPPADWDAQAYLRPGFGMFRGGQSVMVEVEFDDMQARYVRERTFHPTQQREELPAGGVRLRFETTEAALEQVARWLMQYGPQAHAVRPPALRDLLRERLRRAAALYDHDTEEKRDG
ncbi:MAG: WYL domain-containing protein [Candidatus Tectomicrobia bacterium]|uniref:WYL domain-containing protein n=1 Tax=Tectimicrobiota bacterium TaxID=2528274 RepID=A0A937W5D6_UNCTE|nr:WYL domain-containing protein [Candidatus Tectomicrobia bacterium]